MLARRRSGADLPDDPLLTERWLLRYQEALDEAGRTGEWATFTGMVAPDVTVVDRRLVSLVGEVHDRDGYIAVESSTATSSRELARSYEVIAADETLTAVVAKVSGRLVDGGGPFEIPLAVVFVWRAGAVERLEFFDPEDEQAMLARFAELEVE